MITKTVFLASLDTGAFLLGYAGENEHIRYDIRCDSIFSDYPDASVSMLIKSPDGTVYPKVLTIDKPSVYWVVTASDTATDGNGQVQITFTNGDEVIKTVVASTVTMPSLFATGEEPDPIATWVDDANEVLALAVSGIPVEIRTEVAAQMTSTVDDWLEENITNPSSPPLDRSLTLANAAAPADLVGTKADAIFEDVMNQAIASVTDGADGMLVKALTVAVTPVQNLNGQSNPYPAGGGKNLLNDSVRYYNSSNVYFGGAENQSDTSITLPAGTYMYSVVTADGTSTNLYVKNLATGNQVSGYPAYSSTSKSFTLTETTNLCVWAYKSGYTATTDIKTAQIEAGSSATTYAPYSNICPITGWTGANVYRTGKNILNRADQYYYNDNLYFGAHTSTNIPDGTFRLKEGTYTASASETMSGIYIRDKNGDAIEVVYNNTKATFTVTKEQAVLIRFYKSSTTEAGFSSINLQLEVGTSATAYEAYARNTYAISFPGTAGTVYGGTLNATTGVLTVDKAIVGLGSFSWGYNSSYGFYKSIPDGMKSYETSTVANALCTSYRTKSYGDVVNGNNNYSIGIGTTYIAISDSRYTDSTSFKNALTSDNTQLVYELATPVTYELTPAQVKTLLGINNVWADCGNVSMTYPADTKLYIDKVIAAAVAAL